MRRGKANRFARGTRCLLRIALREVRVGHIDVRLKKVRTEIERGAELLDRGIDLLLREENPPERIVGVGAARLDRDDSLEVGLCHSEIALLERRNSLRVDLV